MANLAGMNVLPGETLKTALTRCCGAHRWVEQMMARFPFANAETLFETAETIWWQLAPQDWLEAFTHHPKIGDLDSLKAKFANTQTWAQNEQAGTQQASELLLRALAEGNEAYEAKFGYIFIVCATGKSAEEMLAMLNSRLPNDPQTELRVAAGEQFKITRLRLEKWIREEGWG